MTLVTVDNGLPRSVMTTTTDRTRGLLLQSDSSSVRVEERLTDHGVVAAQVFGEPLLGYGLLIELDISLCEEVVVGLITCGGELVVLGTRLLSGSAHGCCPLASRKVKSRRKCLEAEDDEEKESEVDGEVEESVIQRAHETWR